MERNYQVADESDPYAQTDAVLRETGAFLKISWYKGSMLSGCISRKENIP